jgi:hypothetical protein
MAVTEQASTGFGQQGVANDLPGAAAHGLGRLDHPAIHFPQGGFHQAGEERRAPHHQGRDGPGHTEGGAHQKGGQGDQHDQQNDERQRAQHVDDHRQHPIHAQRFVQLALAGEKQQHAQGQPQHHGKRQGRAEHAQGVQAGLADVGPIDVLE